MYVALQSVEPNPPCYLLLDSLDAQLPVHVCTYIYMHMCNIYVYLRMYVCSSAVRWAKSTLLYLA